MDDEQTGDAYYDFPRETDAIDNCNEAWEEICVAVVDILIRRGIDIKLGCNSKEYGLMDIMSGVDDALYETVYNEVVALEHEGHNDIYTPRNVKIADSLMEKEHARLVKEITEARSKSWKSSSEILKESLKPAGAK